MWGTSDADFLFAVGVFVITALLLVDHHMDLWLESTKKDKDDDNFY